MEPDNILKSMRVDMRKSLDHTLHELSTIHTGKASPAMLESVHVDAYGSSMTLRDVAAITTPDARTLQVEPWDKGLLKEVEKAIQKANLGINPSVRGQSVFCPLPDLSGERRRELVKLTHGLGEQGRVGIRAARREAMDNIKTAARDKLISEDEQKRLEKEVQKETDEMVEEIDQHLKEKEKELTAV